MPDPNGLIVCEGDPGWVAVPDIATPCTAAKDAAKKLDTLYRDSKIDSVLSTIPNLAMERKEKGFAIIQKFMVFSLNHDTTFLDYRTGDVQTGTDSNIVISLSYFANRELPVAWLHTHNDSGYNAHSPYDVFALIENAMDIARYNTSFVASANGNKYALTITDYAKAAAFFAKKSQYLNGRTWNEDSDIGKAFKNAYDYFENGNPEKRNQAYEMAMAAVLNQYNAGVTLNKKDPRGFFKPIVVNTTVIPRQSLFKPEKTIYAQDCL